MRRISLVLLGAMAPAIGGAECGSDCPAAKDLPGPMTIERAQAIDPGVDTGLAVTTTHVYGNCRARSLDDPSADPCGVVVNTDCVRERSSLRVLVVPVNVSLPLSSACGGGFAVSELSGPASIDRRASEDGELVAGLEAGGYRVYLSRDDRCAACGLEIGTDGCLVQIPPATVVARDLVLDEAAH